MTSPLGTTSLKSVCEMQLLHTPATKFLSPKPNTKKAQMSGCDFCTSKLVKNGTQVLKNKTKKQNHPSKSKVELSP